MPLVSVIMPVYNSEKYLSEAIDSVLRQTFQDFELILIDDGSTDHSGKICDEYGEKDNRVRVIHQKNGGICAARNTGLNVANGNYIAFCDNDDKYLPTLLEDNYKLAVEHDADVIRFKRLLVKISDTGKKESSTNPPFPFTILRDQNIWKNYNQVKSSFNAVWAGLYKRAFIEENHIRFDTRMRYSAEDKYFNLLVYDKCKCIILNPKIYYYWMMRYSHSTTGKFNYNFIKTMFFCAKKEYELYNVKQIDQYLHNYWEKISIEYIQEIFRYINRDVCKIDYIHKIEILKKIRRQFVTDRITKERIKDIYHKDSLEGTLWYCLKKKYYIVLYFILKKITF